MVEVISRKEAREQGLKRYYTGKACKHGHVCDRFTCNTHCIECCKLWKKIAYAADPEKYIQRARSWAIANPEKVGEKNRAWRERNPEKSKMIVKRSMARKASKDQAHTVIAMLAASSKLKGM